MSRRPTFLGCVASVSGSTISVRLAKSVVSGLAIIEGSTYRIGQVGSFVRIPLGYQDLYGVVSEVGAEAIPDPIPVKMDETGRWLTVQLVGEAVGTHFERGISQHPNVDDEVHLVVEDDLRRIYGAENDGQIPIGRLSSAENIEVKLDLNRLVTRHSAILGSTGSGKSTSVASILRAICAEKNGSIPFPSSRVILLDIHGEYASALSDIAEVFRINPDPTEKELHIPYWALDPADLIGFLTGVSDDKAIHFYDKIIDLKSKALAVNPDCLSEGIDSTSLRINTPVPYSLKQLWLDMIDVEIRTFKGPNRDELAKISEGDANSLLAPSYEPHAMGTKGPYLNTLAPGVRRNLTTLRSRLMDKQFDFLLHPGPWEPDSNGLSTNSLSDLLASWLGHDKPITILDLSGIPSQVLIKLVGSVLRVTYEAMFWSRDKSEGGRERPLLFVMEEAHRYLHSDGDSSALEIVQRIVKEGRKYGMGAMIVSQRPSEVDETILSQCGTFIALRLSNPADRSKVKGTLPDSLAGLMDMLPILRTGEALITGEAARLPLRCRIDLPPENFRPDSMDPPVAEKWRISRRKESYDRVVASWRLQSPRAITKSTKITRSKIPETEN